MVDVSTLSIVVAATSVVAGVIYYVFQLRHSDKARATVYVGTREAKDRKVRNA
jgi:hypothetical protein